MKTTMVRMEIALFMVLVFIACMYFSAERRHSMLHRTFCALLIVVPVHLLFDAATIYTVNRLDTVPQLLNDVLHRCFIGTMVLAVYLFYRYIAVLIEEETGRTRRLDFAAGVYLAAAEAAVLVMPMEYAIDPKGNYACGIPADICYVSVAVYLLLCCGLMLRHRKQLNEKARRAIEAALLIELTVCLLQGLHPTWLISGMGLTLMTLAFYLTLENPEILRAQLTEQEMSMRYLKSQINPHFLYNTLDAIRIQAQLDGDRKVADLLMQLVDFFRRSVKVDQPMVTLEDELELLDAYMSLMCYRYPQLQYDCDVDPELAELAVPNFILQPMVENSLLLGLKKKGYQGRVTVSARKTGDEDLEINVTDNGIGFTEGKKALIAQMLENYAKQRTKSENSIGILNVQKRIKLLCGKQYGLSYTENEGGGVTAHLLLPAKEEEA